ncbi:diacylglycerol kinase family protein [Draconibacterium halophilum]|uniref:Diacylglycerol kinase family protein n=1 Tax=Draconibacterium halophilum TaxID=2706887 RepID=A0A6C0RHY1_9BACT|nr:diacylglycerol kinase family protein [Draconibacterium halophilum]QIA09677.1 diacylglycerol kinase family protein [Draconibacterium halophilum]
MNDFFKGRAASLKFAVKGCCLLIKTEHSVIAQTSIFLSIIVLGAIVGISKQDWINQTLGMGLVLSIEGVNTAVEKLADFVHIDQHPKIGFIKDIAAGAVTFAAITFFIIFLITYIPYIQQYV